MQQFRLPVSPSGGVPWGGPFCLFCSCFTVLLASKGLQRDPQGPQGGPTPPLGVMFGCSPRVLQCYEVKNTPKGTPGNPSWAPWPSLGSPPWPKRPPEGPFYLGLGSPGASWGFLGPPGASWALLGPPGVSSCGLLGPTLPRGPFEP